MGKAAQEMGSGHLKSTKSAEVFPAKKTAEQIALMKGSTPVAALERNRVAFVDPEKVGKEEGPRPNKREKRQASKLKEDADRLEAEKIVAQAVEDLKEANMLSRKRKRSASNIIKWAALEKEKLERDKKGHPGSGRLEGTGQIHSQTEARGRRNSCPSSYGEETSAQ